LDKQQAISATSVKKVLNQKVTTNCVTTFIVNSIPICFQGGDDDDTEDEVDIADWDEESTLVAMLHDE
jgi:hypothetical protein